MGLIEPLLEFASAAMDLSDGLVKDLDRMCRASSIAVRVKESEVPYSGPARKMMDAHESWRQVGLTGGDDYEVLAAVPAGKAEGFVSAAARAGVVVTRIGEAVEGSGVTVLGADGQPLAIEDPGYDHFSQPVRARRRRP